mgnify:CR=1 FL=1
MGKNPLRYLRGGNRHEQRRIKGPDPSDRERSPRRGNPVYKDLKDVPEYWKGAAAALLDSGAVNGGTPKEVCATDLNLRKETLKAAIVAVMYHEAREKA